MVVLGASCTQGESLLAHSLRYFPYRFSPYIGNIPLYSADLESIVLDCYVQLISRVFGFRSYRTENMDVCCYCMLLTDPSASAHIWHRTEAVPIVKNNDIKVPRSSPKAPVFLSHFNRNWIWSTGFNKNH